VTAASGDGLHLASAPVRARSGGAVEMLSPTQGSVRAAISSIANVVVCDVLLDGVDTSSTESGRKGLGHYSGIPVRSRLRVPRCYGTICYARIIHKSQTK
jgi:hypothetical protein